MNKAHQLTIHELVALNNFDPETLPPQVCSAVTKLMLLYAEEKTKQNMIDALTGHEALPGEGEPS
jgi:hypothetical protein